MEKDFNYNEFRDFMRYLEMQGQEVQLEQRAQTFDILVEMDAVESQVATRPMYSSVDELIQAAKDLK